MNFLKLKTVLIFVGIILYLHSQARAEFRITADMSVREEYNDNIFLTSSDKKDDFITTLTPSVKLLYNSNHIKLTLDYTLTLKVFSDNTDQNDIYHGITLDSDINLYKKIFFLKITDLYTRVPIDERGKVGLDNLFVNMTDTNRFSFNPYIIYPLTDTLNARFDYIYENIWYEADEGDDTENHTISMALSKEFSPRLSSTISYSYLIHRPDKTEEYDKQDTKITTKYLLGPGLTLTGGIGHTWFDYRKTRDHNYTYWDAGIDYKLTGLLSVGAGYSVTFSESTSRGTYKRRELSAYMAYEGNTTSRLSLFKRTDKYVTIDREDRATGLSLDTSFPITPMLTGKITGLYTYYRFLPDEEKVHRYGARLSLDYTLKRTTLCAGYTYNKNNSTLDENDYENNIIWIQARITL